MNKKSGKKILVVLSLSSVLALSACGELKSIGNGLINLYNEQFELDKLLKTNQAGTKFITANTEAPIGVIIKTDATAEDKQEIIDAINEINKISPNIDYVYEESHTTLENYIEIYTDQDIKKENTVGMFQGFIDHQAGTYEYPVRIYLEKDIEDKIGPNGKSYFSHVIKHELMHSLGFKDLTSDIYSGYSVMSYKGTTYGFTDNDIKNIQTVYGKEEIPKQENSQSQIQTQTTQSKVFDYYYKKDDDGYCL